MFVGSIRPGDVAAAVDGDSIIEQDWDLAPDRADEAGRADPLGDLVRTGRTVAGAEQIAQLDLVDAMVAADDDHLHLAVLRNDWIRLQQCARGNAEGAGDLVDRRQTRRLDRRRAGRGRGRKIDAWGLG